MDPPLDRIKLSQTAKDQLIKLKRVTKIPTWNLLCRWALCRSLAEPSIPSPVPTDPTTLATQLRLHLHRGIGYLAGDPHLKRLQDLCHLALQHTTPE